MTPKSPSVLRRLLLALAFLAGLSGTAGAQSVPSSTAPQLVAHWRFEEGSGTVTRDVLGRLPGTLVGSVSFTAGGVAGKGLALDASGNGVVDFGQVLPLTNTAYSISAWFKTPPGDTTPEAAIFAKHQPWYENGYYILLNGGGGTLAGYAGAGAFFHTSATVNDGNWHHVVQTLADNGDVRAYLDGNLLASASGGMVIPSPASFMIGGIDPPPPARRFNGTIDEVQIYDHALTVADVQFLQANPGLDLTQRDVISFQPEPGPVPNPTTITLSTTNQVGQIRYTRDGSEPTANSTLYSGPFSLEIPAPVTLRARVFLNGFPISEERSATYEPDPGIRFSPAGGLFTNQVMVAVLSSIGEVSVRYTDDGSEPRIDSTPFAAPIHLSQTTTLRARAFLNGFPVTAIISSTYRRVYVFDGDGIPSAWRRQYFGDDFRTDPRAVAEGDPDGDGSSNRQEFLAGTHPLDAASGMLVRVRAIPEIRFAAVPGQKYRILRRTSVDDPAPKVLAEITATSTELVYVDPEAGRDLNPAFYLVASVP